jgi:hypothetical protein
MRSLLLVAVLAACPGPAPEVVRPPPPPPPPSPPADAAIAQPKPIGPPRLVVLVVIDQLPQWAFVAKRPHLTRGIDRLLREGEWHTGRHPSMATLTAPGHALLGTGQASATSGILANEWWHRGAGRVIKSVEGLDGTTGAHHLRVPALGDRLAAAGRGAKAVGVSLKDRAAILPVGAAGVSIWYDKTTAQMTSNRPLAWLAAHARAHPIRPRLAQPWTPLDDVAKRSGTTDDQRGEAGDKGFGATFPHAAMATKKPAEALYVLPLGNEVVFEAALAAIEAEQLGGDAVPDLLAVSLSAYDYVGHGWGHESWEAWDMMLRLDEQLERFLDALDAKLGKDGWTLVLTSDHGAAPLPERTGGGRIAYEEIADAANRAAITQLGPGSWIASGKYPYVYLTAAALAHAKRDKVIHKIILALESFPGIELAARTVDYAGACDAKKDLRRTICLALDVERAGEIFYLPRRHWVFVERADPGATAHGSHHDYDREVPVIVRAPGAAPRAAATAPSGQTIAMTEIAGMLARALGITGP